MRVKLEYGKTGLEVTLPDERVMRTLAYKNATPLTDPAGDLQQVLDRPQASEPLRTKLLTGVRGVTFRFMTPKRRWQPISADSWSCCPI